MFQYLRLAFRSLAKTPGYTGIALFTLALGIGVNTAMFSVIDTLLFHGNPFPRPEQLVWVWGTNKQGWPSNLSDIEVREMRARTRSFASLAAFVRYSYGVREPGRPAERVNCLQASPEFFAAFGIKPILGRPYTPAEATPGNGQVVLLTHSYWQSHFSGDRTVLGRTLRLNGEAVTIIGVMPPEFDNHLQWGNTALWQPLNLTQDQQLNRDSRSFAVVGRLREEVTPEQAKAELVPLAAAQEKEHPQDYLHLRYQVARYGSSGEDDDNRIIWLQLGLSGFVLLIACANLANLQLARASLRVHELAIRAALGASRRQLVLQQLTESLVLALAGGTLGIGVALWVNRALSRSILLDGVPGLDIALNSPVLALTLVLAVATGILFGLVPAWLASRIDVNQALKQQGRGASASRSHHRLRNSLIVAEVALALVLLSGAGIMQRGFLRVLKRKPGWDTDKVLTAVLPIPESRFDTPVKRYDHYRLIAERLAGQPGVEAVAVASSLPTWGYQNDQPVLIAGQSEANPAGLPTASHVMVSSDYFKVMGIPLMSGQVFAPNIKAEDPQVIIINEALARKLWPGENPVGKRIGSLFKGPAVWREVIGVVRDVDSAASIENPVSPYQIYRPLVQEPWAWEQVVLRGPNPEGLRETLRHAIEAVDPDQPVEQIATVRQFTEESLHNVVLIGQVLTGFALLGLLLAGIGLYGVISHLVTQRTGEFGIRLALGATPGDVLRLVLRQGLRLTLIGLVIGLGGAYGLGRFLGSMMPRLATFDATAIGAVGLLLLAVALFACWLPARRATKVDPLTALQAE
ncbi:MAG: ABC transporter permease [Opitutales bacterium]